MSRCVSMHGEYSDHILDGDYICTRCNVLDEDALIDERDKLRGALAERDATIARVKGLCERHPLGVNININAVRRALAGEQP